MIKTHMLGGKRTPGAYNTKEHQQTALKIAEEGIVLLKNEKATLPLSVANVKSYSGNWSERRQGKFQRWGQFAGEGQV
jgi:beta-glucosidase-like glycosyl hydrolase